MSIGNLHEISSTELTTRILGQSTYSQWKLLMSDPRWLYHANMHYPLNCIIHGRGIQFFCYITNLRIVENENGSVKWSIFVINSYDAIFSNSLVLYAWQWSFVLPFQLVKTGSRLDQTGFTQYLLFHYSQEKMTFSIYLSIAKKIDYYRRHGIPISYLRAGVQSLIMNLLQFLSSEQTIIILLILELIFKVIKI